ncbi:MAG: serine hydrolase [Bacteroidaceae bacterium]|nr:serine hydrolase [Bacteroidaceae bacterium]
MFPKSYNHSNPLTTSLSTSYSPPLWRGWGWVRLIIALLVGGAFFNASHAQDLLPRSTPEAQGISSARIQEFMDTLMRDRRTEIHSCIVMRHGHVVAEMYPQPWRKDYRHTMYSVSKTFTSVAVGMCIQDSLVALSDTIGKFISMPASATRNVRAITVRDLLTMQSGIPVDTKMRIHETEWLRAYLSKRNTSVPGTRWAYDSIMSYILSAIVQKATGQMLMDFLQDRLFLPLGITDALWEESPEGITCGGWGLYIRPEAMAAFGQFLLNKGQWHGKQLLSTSWVEEMTKAQSVNERYSYHIWQTKYPGWAEANGANGQFIFIIPETDMVVSITQCTGKTAPIQDWIKTMLVDRCMHEALPPPTSPKLPKDSKDSKDLKALKNYTLPLAQGQAYCSDSVPSQNTEVNIASPLVLEDNPLQWKRFGITQSNDTMLLDILDTDGRKYTITLGYGKWIESEFNALPYYNPPFQGNFSNLPATWHVAGSYGWQGKDTLNIELHWVDWLTSASLEINFPEQGKAIISITPHDTGKRTVITQ